MQRPKIVEDYLNAVVPKNIADSTRAEILAEFECHIYDKAEFYIEIGYDEEMAFQRAVDEMGESEDVKREFNSIYKDSSIKGLLLFIGMCTLNILNVSTFSLGYWYFVESSMHSLPNLIEITLFLAGFIFLTVHTIKCCREKLHKQLFGITSAFGLIFLGSIITSGLFYPIFNAGQLVFHFLLNKPAPESEYLPYIINIVVLLVYALLSLISLLRDYRFRTKPYRLSLKNITILLSVISVAFIGVYGFAYAKYEYSYIDYYDSGHERSVDDYFSSTVKEQRVLFLEIKTGDDISTVEQKLTEENFVKSNKNYEDFMWWETYLPYYYRDPLLDDLTNNLENSRYSIFCYKNTNVYEEYCDDVITSIIIGYDSDGKINYKLLIPDTNGSVLSRTYFSLTHGEETEKWFKNLKVGDDCETAMEFIRKTDSYITEDVKLQGNDIIKTYRINLWCYYPLEVSFVDFLFGTPPDDVQHYFNLEIKSVNGVITDLKSVDDW